MPFGECNEVAGWIPRSLHSFRSRSSKRGFSAASHLRLLDLSDLAGGERRPARLLRARFPLLSVIGNSCRCNTPLHALGICPHGECHPHPLGRIRVL